MARDCPTSTHAASLTAMPGRKDVRMVASAIWCAAICASPIVPRIRRERAEGERISAAELDPRRDPEVGDLPQRGTEEAQ